MRSVTFLVTTTVIDTEQLLGPINHLWDQFEATEFTSRLVSQRPFKIQPWIVDHLSGDLKRERYGDLGTV